MSSIDYKKPKLDFVVVGAQKAGTTSLHKILKDHPEIHLPKEKEIHFFDKTPNPNDEQIKAYYQRLSLASDSLVSGEITPDYLLYGYVPSNMKKYLNQHVKIVIILRNPAKRAYSQFNFHRMKGVESNTDFFKAINNESLNHNVNEYQQWDFPAHYLSRGLYYEQVKRFIDCFGADRVHVIIFEKFFGGEYDSEFKKLLNFLGVSNNFKKKILHAHPTKLNKNQATYTMLRAGRWVKNIIGKTIYDRIRERVLDTIQDKPEGLSMCHEKHIINNYFVGDIIKLEKLINTDLSIWYE